MALTLVGRLPTLSFWSQRTALRSGCESGAEASGGPGIPLLHLFPPCDLGPAASPFPGSVPPQAPTTQNTVHHPWMSLVHRGRCQPHPVLGLGHWSWRGAPGRGLGVARLAWGWRSPRGDFSRDRGTG